MYPSREDAEKLFRELKAGGIGNPIPLHQVAKRLGWSMAHAQNVLDLLELAGAVVTFDATEAHPPLFGPRRSLPEAGG